LTGALGVVGHVLTLRSRSADSPIADSFYSPNCECGLIAIGVKLLWRPSMVICSHDGRISQLFDVFKKLYRTGKIGEANHSLPNGVMLYGRVTVG